MIKFKVINIVYEDGYKNIFSSRKQEELFLKYRRKYNSLVEKYKKRIMKNKKFKSEEAEYDFFCKKMDKYPIKYGVYFVREIKKGKYKFNDINIHYFKGI